MTCEEVRVALSAWLDGEDPGTAVAGLHSHTASCPACRDWLAGAEWVGHALRGDPIGAPDLTARVLTALAAEPADSAGSRAGALGSWAGGAPGRPDPVATRGLRQILRVAVGAAALAQFVSALPVLLAGLGVAVEPHLVRELASCDMALAVGFALAAYQPERARAFAPIIAVMAVLMAGTSMVDIANSTANPMHEVGHFAAVVQAGLLWALGRVTGPAGPPLSPVVVAGRG